MITLNDKEMFDFYEALAFDDTTIFGNNLKPAKISNPSIAAFDATKRFDNMCILHNGKYVAEVLLMVDNTLKIFDDYFGEIPGLNHLLASNYTDIEVAMFLSHNDDGSPGRQRDHFTHQFRNAFMGIKMLSDFGAIEKVVANLKKHDSFLNLSFDWVEIIEKEKGKNEEFLKEFIYKTFFITALFHDIGYPLSYYMKVTKKIHAYTPFYKMIKSEIKTPFIDIAAMLMNSLLFKKVDKNDIEKKYVENDHGCLSAISFLSHFYHSGTLFSLNPINTAIIEWAALAIYNHTNIYDYTRMLFADDPISYLHRICDDLQEWNRFSVMLQNSSNYLLCPKCEQIIQKNESNHKFYECSCVGNDKRRYEKITTIESKKLNYIALCDKMTMSNDGDKITISIEYDLYKQLQLMINDFSSIEFREKDLKKVKKLLEFQDGFLEIKLDYFLYNDMLDLRKHLETTEEKYPVVIDEINAMERANKIKWTKQNTNAKREYQDEQIACAKKLLPLLMQKTT